MATSIFTLSAACLCVLLTLAKPVSPLSAVYLNLKTRACHFRSLAKELNLVSWFLLLLLLFVCLFVFVCLLFFGWGGGGLEGVSSQIGFA